MALSSVLQNPRTINKIEPVDSVSLAPPATPTVGQRILVADPVAGDHDGVTATGDFAGNEGTIAIRGATAWEFENNDLYLDNQLLQVEEGREIWLYWDETHKFERATGAKPQEYHEYMGYIQDQDGDPNYVWTQHTLSGTAITPNATGSEFELAEGYVYNVRHRIIATRTTTQSLGIGMFVDGAEVTDDFYGTNPSTNSGSGTFEYRLKIAKGAGAKTISIRDLTGTATDNHDAVLSIEAVAVDGATLLPQTPIIQNLGFIHYASTVGSKTLAAGDIVQLNTIGFTVNTISATEASQQETVGTDTYTKIVKPGVVVVTAQAWNPSTTDQRLTLKQTAADGTSKRQWGNFLSTIPNRASNTTSAFSVSAGDRLYLEAQTAFNYEEGLSLTDLSVSYLSFD